MVRKVEVAPTPSTWKVDVSRLETSSACHIFIPLKESWGAKYPLSATTTNNITNIRVKSELVNSRYDPPIIYGYIIGLLRSGSMILGLFHSLISHILFQLQICSSFIFQSTLSIYSLSSGDSTYSNPFCTAAYIIS